MNKEVMFSSNKDDWETPGYFSIPWDDCYHFTLDVCANADNAKCKRFFTKEQDGLKQSWANEICWCNPPYGRDVVKWLDKAFYEIGNGAVTVMLLPARTDTRWFHKYYEEPDVYVEFIRGRLRFVGAPAAAPFPSMVMIFERRH